MAVKQRFKRTFPILIGDLFIILFSYVAAYYLRLQFGALPRFSEIIPLPFLLLMTLSYLAIFYFFDSYKLEKSYFTVNFFGRIFFSVLVAAIFTSFLKYGLFLFPIGRGILFFANLIILVAIFLWRGFCHKLFKYLIKPKRLIIIGAGKTGQEIAKVIDSTVSDFEILGFLDDDEGKKGEYFPALQLKVLGSTDKIPDLVENHETDQIVMAVPEEKNPQLIKNILKTRLKGIPVIDVPEMYQILKEKVPLRYIKDDWFLKQDGIERSGNIFVIRIKRLIDIFISSLIFLASLPLWLLVAPLIKINSKGPVFYTQKRVGKNESIFSLFKFRSMIEKAEKGEALWADENDKRITLTGKILRKLHLDELPQVWNVIKGEMSLVGPRPERPEFVEKLNREIPYYSFRHFIKPGLTGWAQVNFPYASSLEDSREKLEYDLYYISHMNLFLDFRILLKTIKKVLFRRQEKPEKLQKK
ncbi:MAG: sugar transferase [Candidatus Aminicenantes bacterium]|nr:MAG: sugar transferase [Candidatus Aminicenantes bacterium]